MELILYVKFFQGLVTIENVVSRMKNACCHEFFLLHPIRNFHNLCITDSLYGIAYLNCLYYAHCCFYFNLTASFIFS